jgi:glycosyltransferase involved in cell wall biosynthesis
VSVIIPAFNRAHPLKYTLRSVAAAARAMPPRSVEVILVDDGSAPELLRQLGAFDAGVEFQIVRQANQGSIVARMTGLRACRGEFVLFLDSDDLIHPDKLSRHADAHRDGVVDIVYDDVASATLGTDFEAAFKPAHRLQSTSDASTLLLRIQPLPHSMSYRRSWLIDALSRSKVPFGRHMDPAGDVWLYYSLLGCPARIRKIDEYLTAVGPHPEVRYSQHWERLGIAALQIMESFQRTWPISPDSVREHALVGAVAFESWRRLPPDYRPDIANRLLAIWRRAPRSPDIVLGGRFCCLLARIVGPVGAGRLLRLHNNRYERVRTLSPHELDALLRADGTARYEADGNP